MEFTTYENTANPHVTIHRDGCGQIRKNGGVHRYRNGKYEQHETYEAAKTYVLRTQLPLRMCSFCNPQG